MNKPANDCELELHDLSHDGRGVGRVDGKTVFVAGALPGERVRARIDRRHARFDEAHLREVLQPSPDRVVPPCPHFGECGGCDLQHLAASAQLAAHQAQLAATLARIARLHPDRWLAPIGSTAWGYRARARLALAWDRQRHTLAIGFRHEDSRRIEPIRQCAVLEPVLQELLEPLRGCIAGFEQPGCVRELWLAAGDDGVGVALDCVAAPTDADRARLGEFCAARQVALAFRAGGEWQGSAGSLGYHPQPGLRLGFAPWQFTQANRAVNQALVTQLLALLDPRPHERALDLFSGIGNFTLPLARRVAHITDIEGDESLLHQARANATANGCENTRFLAADLARAPDGAAWAREHYDLVVLDPPRAGAAALTPLLPRLGARRIAYVSCDAATLARDAGRLVGAGLRLEAAGVLDMFPQTAHFETLALFTVSAARTGRYTCRNGPVHVL